MLAGWTPGVHLDDVGIAQARALGARLAQIPVTHVVSSPLARTVETARLLVAARDGGATLKIRKDKRLGECDYGSWSGRKLAKLAKEPLWPVIQARPSAVVFPDGESMLAASARSAEACREWARTAHDELGDRAVVVVVSHGDIIKSVLADALGLHLDLFQRIVVDPGSLSVGNYTPMRSFVERMNDSGGDLSAIVPPTPRAAKKGKRARHGGRSRLAESDAVIGGGAGSGQDPK